jgi:hypothetical protein
MDDEKLDRMRRRKNAAIRVGNQERAISPSIEDVERYPSLFSA